MKASFINASQFAETILFTEILLHEKEET